MRKYGIAFLLILGLALLCHAETALVPSWLPAEYRFAVEGRSNEVAHVAETLALMRDAIHPRLKAQMDAAALGAALQWTVHVLQPNITNDTVYFNTYKPSYRMIFDRDLLTNRIAKLNTLPIQLKLNLIFDEKRSYPTRRAIPGVDYPGVAPEDEGSTEHDIRLVLRAPRNDRNFCVSAEVVQPRAPEYEFAWIQLSGYGRAPEWTRHGRAPTTSDIRSFLPTFDACRRVGPGYMAVFARRKGQYWGVPSFIHVASDPLCTHWYERGHISRIDYGAYRDEYKLDEKNRIIGFLRFHPGDIKGKPFSAHGEYIRDTYSEDRPKTVSPVRYAVNDGKLTYEISGETRHLPNQPNFLRTRGW